MKARANDRAPGGAQKSNMKYLWLAVISTSLILRAAPVRSQEDANITPDVTTDLPPTVTIEEAATVIPETPTESPEPDPALDPASDPASQPPPAAPSGEPVPEEGSQYDYTDEGEDYNMIPHVPENCSDIRVFSARGSNEPYPGRGGDMLGVMCSLFEETGVSCDYEDVVYPANISYSGIFCESANIGANAGQAQMADYIQRCPGSKLVLTGYSQGGGVVGDILGGGGGFLFGCDQASNPPLSRKTTPGSSSKSPRFFLGLLRTSDLIS